MKKIKPVLRTGCLLILIYYSCQRPTNSTLETVRQADPISIDSTFIVKTILSLSADDRMVSLVIRAYKNNQGMPIWLTDRNLLSGGPKLLAKAKQYAIYDFDIESKLYDDIKKRSLQVQGIPANHSLKTLDVGMTTFFYEFSNFLAHGKLNPVADTFKWQISQKVINLDEILIEASRNGGDPLSKLEPAGTGYSSLREAHLQYLVIKDRGGWPVITAEEKLELGMEGPEIAKLRKRLQVTGDLSSAIIVENPDLFDKKIKKGLIHFQKRHGLYPDGVAGEKTVEALNIPVEDRISQLVVNMERHKWLPEFGEKHIVVNIPEYMASLNIGQEVELDMRIIVGTDEKPTPIFNDTLEYLVMSPYWVIPESIVLEEIAIAMQNDTNYIYNNNMEVIYQGDSIDPNSVEWTELEEDKVPFTVRQKPGITNSLGTIKFMFPNKHWVYLHDTNAKGLFTHTERSFSHGCIRINKPLELALLLLDDEEEWDEEKINEAREENEPQIVKLKEKVPIYIYYMTSWVDDSGLVQFRHDIYNYDRVMKEFYYNRDHQYSSEVPILLVLSN